MTQTPPSPGAHVTDGLPHDPTLARVDHQADDGRPTVLFLCTHNAGRSQMALGFFQHYAGDAAVAWSGGSEPGDR